MSLIFTNQTANGDSLIWPGDVTDPVNTNARHNGGPILLAISGTFDGASIALSVDQDNLGFITLQNVTQTVPDVNRVVLASGTRFKLTISGVGASTDISASVISIS